MLAAVVCLGLTIAACGGSDDTSSDDTSSQDTSSADTSSQDTSSADTSSEDTSSQDTSSEEQPQEGGTLRVSLLTGTNSLDPTRVFYGQASQGSGTAAFAVFGGLVIVDRETESVEPLMAESLETTDNGSTWVLKLRPNLVFSDGTPFDADAVKFNWDRIADPASPSNSKSAIDGWTSYEVTDPLTLTIKIPKPNLQFPRVIAGGSFNVIGSPTAIANDPEGFGLAPVGAGPFILKEFTPGSQLRLEKNPTYFDAPRPYVDELIIRFVVDDNQRVQSFLANEDDVTYLLTDVSVKEVEAQGKEVTLAPSTQTSPLKMNSAIPPLDDLRVRKAFWQAADIAALCAARQGAPCENPPTGLFGEDSPYYTPEGEFPEHDLEAAQQLIDEYRAEKNIDAVKVEYSYIGASEIATNVATVLQSNLQRLEGVEITLNPVDATVYSPSSTDGLYQMSSGVFAGSSPDEQVYENLHSSGVFNKSIGASSPEMDAALESTRTSDDPAVIKEGYAKVAQIAAENVLFLPYFDPVYAFGHDPKVRDLAIFSDTGLRVDRIWLEQ